MTGKPEFANKLCHAARPSDKEIVEMIIKLNGAGRNHVSFKKLLGQKHNPARLRRSLAGLLRTLYSLEESESAPIIQLLMSGPLAQRLERPPPPAHFEMV